MKVNYAKIYEVLKAHRSKVITPSQLAYSLGVERIYGATMAKLVREGALEPAAAKGYYYIVGK